MKILLVYPYCLEERYYEENVSAVPIGLYYLGALLIENRYDVEVLNFYDAKNDRSKIESVFKEKQADVIGFSVFNANRWGAIELAEIVKGINPNCTTVFGGVSATFLWEHFLGHFPEIDFVVCGEGEYSFLDLVRAIEQNDLDRVKSIPGIAFRDKGAIINNGLAEPVANLDDLPNPAKYFSYQYVTLTRGCPADCNFCGSPQFWRRKVRWHSADYFVTQLELLHAKGISFFYFSDDTFTLKRSVVVDICRKIVDRGLGIAWYAIARVDQIDEEVLAWMRKAGCIQVSYGVESGSETIRKLLNKQISQEQIKRAFSLTSAFGILARAYFIYGCPGECEETIQATLELIHEIKPLSVIFYVLRLFPGTAFYCGLKERQAITDDVWLEKVEDIPYYRYDPNLSEQQVTRFGEQLRLSYYQALPTFARSVKLRDSKELYPLHAEFLSRLAMTFSHGDYAQIDAIPDKEQVALALYGSSLRYYPDHRAFLGLGILKQKNREYKQSAKVLEEGVKWFPNSEMLHMCLGLSYLNLAAYDKAIAVFSKFPDSREAVLNLARCYQAIGDREKEKHFLQKLQSLPSG